MKGREKQATEIAVDRVSSLGSEESFAGLLYVARIQSRGNKELEEKLSRLGVMKED